MTEHGMPIWFFIGALLVAIDLADVRAFRPRRR
jgi:hypothetical protein